MKEPWETVISHLSKYKGCGKNDHPKVVALISDKSGKIIKKNSHKRDSSSKLDLCKHAEEEILNWFLKNHIPEKNNDYNNLKFYTSLEPCNVRGFFRIPCAHKISVLHHFFEEIHIGSLDPDPNVFGRGTTYLLENLPLEKRSAIKFTNKEYRQRIYEANQGYIRYCNKKFRNYFEQFKQSFPIFTGFEEEDYLKIAHGLARWFDGDEVWWYFPKFPTFGDIFKFHAWWAEGFLENKRLKKIYLVVNMSDFKEGIDLSNENNLFDEIKNEFYGTEQKVLLKEAKLEPAVKAAFFLKKGKIEAIVIPFYQKLYGKLISHFWVCNIKQLAFTLRVDIKDLTEGLRSLINNKSDFKPLIDYLKSK